MKGSDQQAEEGEDDEESEGPPLKKARRSLIEFGSMEAKDSFSDNYLAQLAAQTYDVYQKKRLQQASLSTGSGATVFGRGILTTGRRWKFFSIHPPSTLNGRPILSYDGEMNCRVLRAATTVVSATTSSSSMMTVVEGNRRHSGLDFMEHEVKREEVRNVLAAVCATLVTLD